LPVLAVFAAGVLAGAVEAVVAGLLGVVGVGGVAGFEAVVVDGLAAVVAAGFEVVVPAAGFALVDAVLLVEVDLLDEVLPVGLVDLVVFDFVVVLEVLEFVGEVELLPVLCANKAPEPAAPINRDPRTRNAISFLTFTFILSPYDFGQSKPRAQVR
jgi:hypothetical protein